MRRAAVLVVAASLGFWLNEALHLIYSHTLNAPPKGTNR